MPLAIVSQAHALLVWVLIEPEIDPTMLFRASSAP
jgi:hypothetical protein